MEDEQIEELIKNLQEAQKLYEQNSDIFAFSPEELLRNIIEYQKLRKALKKEQENENIK